MLGKRKGLRSHEQIVYLRRGVSKKDQGDQGGEREKMMRSEKTKVREGEGTGWGRGMEKDVALSPLSNHFLPPRSFILKYFFKHSLYAQHAHKQRGAIRGNMNPTAIVAVRVEVLLDWHRTMQIDAILLRSLSGYNCGDKNCFLVTLDK